MNVLFKKIATYAGVVLFVAMPLLFSLLIYEETRIRESYAAIKNGSTSELQRWLPFFINTYFQLPSDKNKTTLLIEAIKHKPDDPQTVPILRIILSKKNIDVNRPEKIYTQSGYKEGRRPIHWAVERGNVEAVKLLVQKRANTAVIDPLTHLFPLSFVQREKNAQLREAWHLDEIEQILISEELRSRNANSR